MTGSKRHTGHIRPHGPGRWRCVAYAGRKSNGKPAYVWQTFTGTERQARKHVEAMAADIAAGRLKQTDGRQTVGEWLATWIEGKKADLSGKTHERYESMIRQHVTPGLGHHKIAKLTALHVEAFYKSLLVEGRKQKRGGGLSALTVRHIHAMLRTAFRDAKRLKIIAESVIEDARPPAGRAKVKAILTPEQATTLMQAVDALTYRPAATAIALALLTGARRGEVLALRWADLDTDNCALRFERSLEEVKGALSFKVTKTAAGERTIAIPASLVDALKAHRVKQAEQRLKAGPAWQNHDLICCNEIGGPVSPDSITKRFRKIVRRLGIPAGVTFHSLRHTHATYLLEVVGASDRTVADRIGHASPAVTKAIYGHRIKSNDALASDGFAALIGTAKSE